MAGSNKIFKSGQIVFKAGDPSDGMYVVRRGELSVFLEKDGKEVVLATIGEGGMVGEMALFDKLPRSASVKAMKESEVTLITLDDFSKLMKQIPKWFVGLMGSLSSRLRQTNERLQKAEAGGSSGASSGANPAHSTYKLLNLLELLWHKEGVKDGKEWTLSFQVVKDFLAQSAFKAESEMAVKVIEVLGKESMMILKTDSAKGQILSISSRNIIKSILDFLDLYMKQRELKVVGTDMLKLLKIIEKAVAGSAYDSLTLSAEDALAQASAEDKVIQFIPLLSQFTAMGEAIKTTKTSTKSGIGVKISKKEFAQTFKMLRLVHALQKASAL